MALNVANFARSQGSLNQSDPIITMTGQAAGTVVYGPFFNPGRALRLLINITNFTGSLTVTLLGYDLSSGASWTVLASTALAANALTRLSVGPTVAAAANVASQDYAPVVYQVQCVVATGPVTGTITAESIG